MDKSPRLSPALAYSVFPGYYYIYEYFHWDEMYLVAYDVRNQNQKCALNTDREDSLLVCFYLQT